MDNMPPGLAEKSQNGGGISNGSSFRRPSVRPISTSSALDGSIPISPTSNFHTVVVVVHKDENGYGMNVSGDNPVYVQSVKEGGAAEKAGLQCGDMIIKVNGVNVTQSTHTQVVSLIRASNDVELTVRQNCRNQLPRGSIVSMTSSPHLRPIHSHASSVKATDRITGPQPVDEDKLRQLETQRLHTFRLMLEKEQLYVDALRFELAKCIDPQNESKIQQELNGATRRVSTLQEQLKNLIAHSEHSYTFSQLNSPVSSFQIRTILEGQSLDETPPPLPTRNRSFHSFSSPRVPTTGAGPPLPPRCNNLQVPSNNSAACLSNQSAGGRGDDNVSCNAVPPHAASLGHHRTKSNPDPLGPQSQLHNMTPTEACRRLIASESLQDIYKRSKSHPGSCDVDSPHESPSGTPPPPYRGLVDDGGGEEDVQLRPHVDQTPDVSPLRGSIGPQSSTPISQNIISMEDDDTSDQEFSHLEDHGPFKSLKCLWQHHAHLAVFMNYVLSNSDPSSLLFYLVTDLYKEGNAKEMKKWAYEIHSSFLVPGAPLRLNNVDENFAREIDDVLLKESDKEEILRMIFRKARIRAREELNEQLADFQQKRTAGLGTLFGPSDASLEESILDKNKEMKIIENILIPKIEAYMEDIEKDNVDIRRFTTAAALGTIMGKVFGLRGPHASSVLDRCPTFVSKDKSLKAKLLIGKSRKLSVRGHHFVAHHYYTVTYCNHCQLIIWGIGPQGYQCTNCNFNVHRYNCIKFVEENCPGPICKKDRGDNRISKLMEKIRPEREARRKPSSLNFTQSDRNKKHSEERDDSLGIAENDMATGDRPVSGLRGVEKRPDTVRESEERPQNDDDTNADNHLKGDSTASTEVEDTVDTEEGFIGVYCKPCGSESAVIFEPGFMVDDLVKNIEEKNAIGMFQRKSSLPGSLPPDITHHTAKAKNSATNINRSESYRERIPQKKVREKRKTSDPNLSKTTDANLEAPGLSYNTNSGSSSNSSLSTRSLDSPSAAVDMVTATQPRSQEPIPVTLAPSSIPPLLEDSDSEAEPDPPDWTRRVDENVLKSMTPREKKRQEVINELFHTEKTHVRKLKVLDQVFLKPMQDNQILPSDQLHLLFQNLEEMLDIHGRFNNAMKAKKKEDPLVGDIGDILLNMFDGTAGDNFQRAASVFCANQQIALEQLKERRKKDTKLNNFLTEAESNPLCRRLQLKDMLPTVMQRLTKYPLLFDNLAKYSPKGSEEEKSVQQAVERSKDILNYVNQAVRAVEDHQRLAEIQKKLDKSAFEKVDHPMANEFRNLDLRTHKLIYEGSLNWRIGNRQKLIDIHVLLLHDAIILLQKQDEKYVLKFYNVNAPSGGAPALSPIVKVSSVLVRDNAVDKTALYLVNTSHNLAQIYDLVASSPNERKIWFRHISEAADAYKHKDSFGRNRRTDPTVSIPQSPPDAGGEDESPEKTKEPDDSHDSDRTKEGNELDTSGTSQDGAESTQSNDSSQQQSALSVPHPSPSSATSPDSSEHGRKSVDSSPSQRRKVEPVRLSTVQNLLIQPSQVVVLQNPVLTAEPVLTPLEQIRVKDEEIRRALLAKQQLVADVLHVPKEEFDTIAEMAGEPSVDKEATELVLAAVNQANQLAAAVNDALKVTEEEAVTVTSEVLPGHSPRGGRRKTRLPGVPALKLQGISNSLNSQLTQLLKIVKERDEEREMLRKELQRSREQIHVLHETHRKSRKSPAHSRLAEDVTEESGDLTRDQVTESKNETEETVAGGLHLSQETQDLNLDTSSEVFVDALSENMEALETQPDTSEKEEDPPI